MTDRTDGIAGADINTEIIQEQSVFTGAIPAEFVGAPGLISNVVTKSGGNQFSGSINYYLQNDSFVEDLKGRRVREANERAQEQGISLDDPNAFILHFRCRGHPRRADLEATRPGSSPATAPPRSSGTSSTTSRWHLPANPRAQR